MAAAWLVAWAGIRFASAVSYAQGAAPQAPAAVATGARVRVWQEVGASLAVPVVGRVTELAADTVGLEPDGDTRSVSIPRASIKRIEVSGGEESGARAREVLTGAIVGAVGGVVLGVVAGNIANRNAPKLGVVGLVVGGAAGAGIGAAVPTEGWVPAELPSLAGSRP